MRVFIFCVDANYLFLDGNEFLVAASLVEFYHTGNLGEKSIIFTPSDIQSGMEFGPALTDNNRSGGYRFTRIGLDTAPLAVTVAAIA